MKRYRYLFIGSLMLCIIVACHLIPRLSPDEEDFRSRKTTKVEYLGSPVKIGETPVYLRDNAGTLEYSNNGVDWSAVGSGGGAGDMLQSVYDMDTDNRVDVAENLYDGIDTVTTADIQNHLESDDMHFQINDSTTSTSTVWSSNKVNMEIANIAIPSPSEYALRGTGTGNLASATFAPAGFFTGNNTFSLYGVVVVEQLNRAESFYQHVETEYSENVLNFGKTSDNRLQLTLGSNTYTSGVLFTSDMLTKPVEIGVICNKTGGTVAFFFDGTVEASQAATYTFPTINLNEQHRLGAGLDGDVLFFSVTKGLIFDASTKHTPISEGLSQCPFCLVHYDMDDEESGTTLADRFSIYNLTVAGTWQEYPEQY